MHGHTREPIQDVLKQLVFHRRLAHKIFLKIRHFELSELYLRVLWLARHEQQEDPTGRRICHDLLGATSCWSLWTTLPEHGTKQKSTSGLKDVLTLVFQLLQFPAVSAADLAEIAQGLDAQERVAMAVKERVVVRQCICL